MTKNDEKINVLSTLRDMKVGESKSFPVERGPYVKSVASDRGLVWGVSFSTSVNRQERTITVTRNA